MAIKISKRNKSKPRKTKMLRPTHGNRNDALDYLRALRRRIKEMQKSDKEIADMAESDAGLRATLKFLHEQEKKHTVTFIRFALPIATVFTSRVSKSSRKSIETAVKQSLGAEKVTITDAKRTEKVIEASVKGNVTLITSIPPEHFAKIEKAVRENFAGIKPEGVSLRERIRDIGKANGITDSRAQLIARDQTGKLTAQITRSRYEDLGAKRYIWKTAGGIRVVGTPGGLYPKGSKLHGNHFKRNNRVFYYNNPPSDGNPGEPIQCRCVAQPVFENLKSNKNVQIE